MRGCGLQIRLDLSFKSTVDVGSWVLGKRGARDRMLLIDARPQNTPIKSGSNLVLFYLLGSVNNKETV